MPGKILSLRQHMPYFEVLGDRSEGPPTIGWDRLPKPVLERKLSVGEFVPLEHFSLGTKNAAVVWIKSPTEATVFVRTEFSNEKPAQIKSGRKAVYCGPQPDPDFDPFKGLMQGKVDTFKVKKRTIVSFSSKRIEWRNQ